MPSPLASLGSEESWELPALYHGLALLKHMGRIQIWLSRSGAGGEVWLSADHPSSWWHKSKGSCLSSGRGCCWVSWTDTEKNCSCGCSAGGRILCEAGAELAHGDRGLWGARQTCSVSMGIGVFQIQSHEKTTLLHGQTGSLPVLPQLLGAWEGKTKSHSKD